MSGSSPRRPATPWTTLLGDIVDKKHRTANAKSLIVTLTACIVVLLVATAVVVALVYLTWGGVAAGGFTAGLLTLVGIGRWAVRRRRSTGSPSVDSLPGSPP